VSHSQKECAIDAPGVCNQQGSMGSQDLSEPGFLAGQLCSGFLHDQRLSRLQSSAASIRIPMKNCPNSA
jgi:hypothetical protein